MIGDDSFLRSSPASNAHEFVPILYWIAVHCHFLFDQLS
jgi:hypothetical protein